MAPYEHEHLAKAASAMLNKTPCKRTKPPLEHKESERAALTERCARESENAREHERMNRARVLR